MEWRERIREWQEQQPDNGQPVENTSLPDLQLSALFLQHPFTAMSLWNVMQRFYVLDRAVCSTSKESLDKIREWEDMSPFKYLEAGKVEKRWRSSLQDLGKDIKESSRQAEEPSPPEDQTLSGLSATQHRTKGISKSSDNGIKSEVLLKRIDGIYSGIAKLDSSLRELRRNLKKYLESVDLRERMLQRIIATAKIRYSMIDTYLKMDENENSEVGDNLDRHSDHTEFLDNTLSHEWPWKAEYLTEGTPRRFKPLSRTNSMDLVKHRLVITWMSTRRGDATASAILLLIIILACLIQIQRYLIAGSEFGSTSS
ncbi:hypothetical protein N431DRAFT_433075 [Stipitochalara longipes BDJ]|nr:hypothetical protein N431DRAFT_433075 [Stipitochalara longipes BDJ]